MLKWKQVTDELVCLINTNIYLMDLKQVTDELVC